MPLKMDSCIENNIVSCQKIMKLIKTDKYKNFNIKVICIDFNVFLSLYKIYFTGLNDWTGLLSNNACLYIDTWHLPNLETLQYYKTNILCCHTGPFTRVSACKELNQYIYVLRNLFKLEDVDDIFENINANNVSIYVQKSSISDDKKVYTYTRKSDIKPMIVYHINNIY